MNLRLVSIGLSVALLLGMTGILMYLGSPKDKDIATRLIAFSFWLPFYGFPPIVSMVLSILTRKSATQIILMVASLLYGVWFMFAIYIAFYVDGTYQAALFTLFAVGIFALPVLLPLWIAAIVVEIVCRKKKTKEQQ